MKEKRVVVKEHDRLKELKKKLESIGFYTKWVEGDKKTVDVLEVWRIYE
jgi:hypothetical protein